MDLLFIILSLSAVPGLLAVIILDQDNISAFRSDPSVKLVLVSSDETTPELEKLEEALRTKKIQTVVAAVPRKQKHVVSQLDLPEKEGIYFITGDDRYEYTGIKQMDPISEWIIRKQGARVITEKNEISARVERNGALLVGFFDSKDSEEAKIYNEVATLTDAVDSCIVTDSDIMTDYRAEPGSILLLKKYDEPETNFFQEFSKENLLDFIQRETLPNLIQFKLEHAAKVMNCGRKIHFLLVSDSNDEEHDDRTEAIRKVGQLHRNDMLFVHVDLLPESQPVLDLLSVSENMIPGMFIYELETGYRYMQTGAISLMTVNKFLMDYKEGNLERIVLSESLPNREENEPVKTLVSLTFMEAVNQNESVVFVMVYAPWSDKCKELAEVWNQLGDNFTNDKKVTMAKMNGIKNEILTTHVDQYPSIVWVPRGGTDVLVYKGKKNYESLKKFIEKKISDKPDEKGEDEEEEEEDEDEDDEEELEEDNRDASQISMDNVHSQTSAGDIIKILPIKDEL